MAENGDIRFKHLDPIKPSNAIDVIHAARGELAHELKSFLLEAQSSGFTEEVDRMIEEDPEMAKSYDIFIKAMDKRGDQSSLAQQMIAMMIDPDYQVDSVENYDFPHERVKPVILRRAGNSIPCHLIKSHRTHQLAEFGNVSDGKTPGFILRFIDDKKVPSATEKKKIAKFQHIFSKDLFYIPNEDKPSLKKFLAYAYNDFFDLDKIAVAIVRTRASANRHLNYRGTPMAMQLLDGGTIYHIVPSRHNNAQVTKRWDIHSYNWQREEIGLRPLYRDEYRYIQVDRYGQRRAIFRESEMILAHAYGTSDVNDQFMGMGIVEKSLKVLRYIMDSVIYNYTRRSTQTMPKGMIAIKGATEDGFSREEMALFRKLIWAISAGRKNQWKYPVIGLPKQADVKFVKFHESSKEMEDFLWWSTLMSLLCTYAGLRPEDINMASNKSTIGKQRLFDKKDEEGGVARSQDMGLRFFLSHFENLINANEIVEEITGMEGLEFRFAGLDVEDEIKKTELNLKRLMSDTSINELLTAADKKPFKIMMGDVNIFDVPGIANQQIQQAIMQTFQQQQMAQDQGVEEFPWDQEDIGKEGQPEQEAGGIGGETAPGTTAPPTRKSMKPSVIIRVMD